MVTIKSPRNLEPIGEKYSFTPNETILDAGCGYGGRSLRISNDFNSHVISVDLSLNCLKTVKQIKKARNIDLIHADVEFLPLKDSSIDKIVCADVLEHVPNVSHTLDGFKRTLAKNGMIFLLVPSRVSETLYMRLDSKYIEHKDHLRTFKATEFYYIIESGGFRVVDIYHAEFFRAIYHLLQVLTGSQFERQTGRPITEDFGLSAAWRISRVFFYSWIGSLVETVGSLILPNSLIVIATKK